MRIIITETETIKFFKWVIFTKTIIRDNKIESSEPVYVPNTEYYKREFF